MFKILNYKKNSVSNNVEKNINITLDNNNKMLPVSDIDTKIDEYEKYLEEKKNSHTYRLSFNITPICSNVLFNKISEIVYCEGGQDCIVFGAKGPTGNVSKNRLLDNYCKYKNLDPQKLNRETLIKDTGFSHLECGALVYHCGYDIFNNHMLRKKEFNIINKLGSVNKEYFNTIYDYQRDFNGNEIIDYKNNLENGSQKEEFYKHVYMVDTLRSFEESINENLIEKNGWVGFINPSTLNINNFSSISLNKCMNNNKSCEMIDMYPDRSLYSFIPKINKYRNNRVEKNWDYCLTYPYENFYDNILIQFKNVNGLKCEIVDKIFDEDGDINIDDGKIVTLKTIIKNNFSKNSLVNIVLIGDIDGEEKIIPLENNEKIIKVGYNGKNKNYFFSIYGDELLEKMEKFTNPLNIDIRVRRVNDGSVCSYYFRKFRRIPNFNNTNVYTDGYISDEEIKKYSNKDFNSTLNGLGFSRTIYNDRNAQILFNDDINLKGLKNNLGREVNEIFLTIVKNNDGHEKWYKEKKYTDSAITFSHCFSKITSGIDIMDSSIKDYNIHKIHNVTPKIIDEEISQFWGEIVDMYYSKLFNITEENNKKIYKLPLVLEDDINIHGNNGDNCFLGDIVEFNKYTLKEHILEPVYHRFNTEQREILDAEYRDVIIDEIKSDDYDLISGFTIEKRTYNKINDEIIPINIDAEGYYYNPHYKITLKEYKDKIKQGQHTIVGFTKSQKENDNIYIITANKNYYFETMDVVYIYNIKNNAKTIGRIIDIKGKNKNELRIKCNENFGENLNECVIYKPNSEKPDNAYELDDGTGRYLWQDLKDEFEYDINNEISKYVFTNNAHYINTNLIFNLFRQDPNGDYGISNTTSNIPIISNLSIDGVTNDYEIIETLINEIEEEGLLC